MNDFLIFSSTLNEQWEYTIEILKGQQILNLIGDASGGRLIMCKITSLPCVHKGRLSICTYKGIHNSPRTMN